MSAYILSHWRGAQSLAWSFWVNLVAIRCIVFVCARFTLPPYIDQPALAFWLTVLYFVIFQVIVLCWQIVGVVRAADNYFAGAGAMEWVWASHAGIIFALLVTAVSVFGSAQSALVNMESDREIDADRIARERASEYSFSIVDARILAEAGASARTGELMRLSGSFELGITRDLKAFLKRHPMVKGVVLSSDGGRIYEGRGIAAVMQERGLATYVFDRCNSACTTAFIGGKPRFLSANGKLGFHQYWHDAQLQHAFINLAEEQERDAGYYAAQHISAAFLKRVFGSAHTGLWQPDHKTLLAAGVVHKILPARDDLERDDVQDDK